MYFSDIMQSLREGKFNLPKNKDLDSNIYYIVGKKDFKLYFYGSDIEFVSEENTFKFKPTDFNKFELIQLPPKETDSEDKNTSNIVINYDGKQLLEVNYNAISLDFFSNFAEQFVDDEECTPLFQLNDLVKKLKLVDADIKTNEIQRLLFIYKDSLLTLYKEGHLKPESVIKCVLEEDSGKILDNMGETVKKNLSIDNLFSKGLHSILDTGVALAKSAGKRIGQNFIDSNAGEKNLLILTDKNVVYYNKNEPCEFELEEAKDVYSSRADEVLAGVVDIYDYDENKVLNNINQTEWSKFRTLLRNQIKEQQEMPTITQNNSVASSDDGNDIKSKLLKLKQLLDLGVITQEDFDAKKAEILSTL